jgi:8-oxo-dGTP diphosphatase
VREGVVIVLQRGVQFLVGQRASHKPAAGYWTQLSGKIEAGESQQQTVVREANEEIGCRVRAVEKLREAPSVNGQYLLHYWRAEIIEGEPVICDDELTELRWVTALELQLLSPVFQEDVDLMYALGKDAN